MTEDKRKEIMNAIGYEYNEAGIKKLQADYMTRKNDVDGIWGPDTENCALTVYYTKKHTKNFNAKEFACECGRYCCGYPDYMKPEELVHIQAIRDHWGKPITVTCGLRCRRYNNSLAGSSTNSGHLYGYAIDFYQPGVTDTSANRKAAIAWIKKQPNHDYTYGNAVCDSNGLYRSASNMGNAMHTETHKGSVDINPSTTPKTPTTPTTNGKIAEDGIGGPETVKAAQKKFGTAVDGVISGQIKSLAKYFTAFTSVTYGGGGSKLVIAIQKWAGCTPDGTWGQQTSKAVQRKLGVEADGYFGPISMKAFQKYLNTGEIPKPEPRYKGQVIDVSYVQKNIDWEKVKADGIVGAIIRCGFRGYGTGQLKEDEQFLNHIKGAKKAGLKIGVYFFTEAINAKEGKEEAQYTLSLIKKAGIAIDYPIAVDTEWINADDYVRANNISKSARTAAIKAFCEEIKANGYKPMIYASLSWYDSHLDMSQLPYDIWCAQYYSKCQYKGKYLFWQYTSKGDVNGIKGVVDMNRCYL